MKQNILIIEDEEDLQMVLQYSLQKEGYQVDVAGTGLEGLEKIKNKKPSLLILDLNLPDMSGLDVCKQIRANKDCKDLAIVMLTAKSQENDRVHGFEAGADDYVSKPFSTRELILRIQALFRRVKESTFDGIKFAEISLDIHAHQCFIANQEVMLTALEFRLLRKFLENEGLVLTRDVLLSDVWNMDPKMNTRTVDKHVQRLRNKMGEAGRYILTIRGVGYRLNKKEE